MLCCRKIASSHDCQVDCVYNIRKEFITSICFPEDACLAVRLPAEEDLGLAQYFTGK